MLTHIFNYILINRSKNCILSIFYRGNSKYYTQLRRIRWFRILLPRENNDAFIRLLKAWKNDSFKMIKDRIGLIDSEFILDDRSLRRKKYKAKFEKNLLYFKNIYLPNESSYFYLTAWVRNTGFIYILKIIVIRKTYSPRYYCFTEGGTNYSKFPSRNKISNFYIYLFISIP